MSQMAVGCHFFSHLHESEKYHPRGEGGGEEKEEKRTFPTNIGITRGTPSVATLVVVSQGVEIWVGNARDGAGVVRKKP